MGAKVMLCIDEESARRPEVIGLAGENLFSQPWLDVRTNAQSAREGARQEIPIEEVWVASCDDVEPVNLAAAIKRDNPRRRVSLLSGQPSGSLQSRIRAAGVDAALSHQALAERYAFWKERSLNLSAPAPCHSGSKEVVQNDRANSADARKGRTAEERVKLASLITVASGSGGAGKSALSAVAAALLAASGRKTLLLDGDLQFGDMRELFGAEHAFGIDETLSGTVDLGALPYSEGVPCVLAAPRRLEQSEALSGRLGVLVDSVLPHFDVVVANTGANWGEHHAALLERSSKALMVVDQRSSSLRACKHALELCSRCGIATTPFSFVVNRCSKRSLFSSIDVSCAMQGANAFELQDGGMEVEEMLGSGLACDLARSRNAFVQSVRELLDALLADSAGADSIALQKEPQPRGLFSRRRRGRGADL